MGGKLTVKVTDAPFCAKGDGITNDRSAIQKALDYVHKNGGGTVVLSGGRTFMTDGAVIKSGVTLFFEDDAVLEQIADRSEYLKPVGDGYEPYLPAYGHNFSEKIKWSHNWYVNYPFIFAPEGMEKFAVKGKGIIKMMEVTDEEKVIKLCPIGFYRCSDFEISDVHITNYHGYAMMPFTSHDGIIRNVKIDNPNHGNGDGICLMNCQNIRVTGCDMMTGDDSLYIFSSCMDPRKSEWWSSDEPQPSVNIEVDHNNLISNHCKAFGWILWGLNCPDREKVEVRNVYIHDNHFETIGVWLWNPYTDMAGDPPVTGVRWENNVIDGIESNFFETQISDMNFFRSTSRFHNGNFEQGRVFWSMDGSADVSGKFGDENRFGRIYSFDKGRSALYQGVYIRKDNVCFFKADLKTENCTCRMFVRNLETGETVATQDFSSEEWSSEIMYFTVPEDGNYHVGIENGSAASGSAQIKFAVLGYNDSSEGCKDAIFDRGKVIFRYNDNLFRR